MSPDKAREIRDEKLAEIRALPKGGRDDGIFARACKLYNLANAAPDVISHSEVESLVLEAGLATGLPARQIRGRLKSARRRVGDSLGRLRPCREPGDYVPREVDFGPILARAERMVQGESGPESYVRPPPSEVDYVWRSCGPCPEEILASLSGKARGNICPAHAIKRDLVRYLPEGLSLPRWARCWPAEHRVIVPLRGPDGAIVSLHARAATGSDRPKQFAPRGYQIGGTVFGNLFGVEMLRREPFACGYVREAGVVITEGTPSFIAWSTSWEARLDGVAPFEGEPAVLGYYSGTWSKAIADAIPDGTRILLDPDYNATGRRMAEKIIDTLGERVELQETLDRRAA